MAVAEAVNTLEYYPELCTGCGLCTIVCPHQVFAMNGRIARLVRYEACMECGACQLNCAAGAITVESGVGCASAMIQAALLTVWEGFKSVATGLLGVAVKGAMTGLLGPAGGALADAAGEFLGDAVGGDGDGDTA